ncbi:MAG: hypothetical protein RL417_1389, partial [Pseudomonadota bacterium]
MLRSGALQVVMNSAEKILVGSSENAESTAPTPIPLHPRGATVVGEPRQRMLVEPIGDLDSLVASLVVAAISPVERAHGVLAVLRRIVHAESGSYNLSIGLKRFLERLWSGSAIGDLVSSVYERARALSLGRSGEGLDENVLVNDLRRVVEWYSSRRASIAACRQEGFVEGESDALFNLQVSHDERRWGLDGMVVSCGLRFIARAHETLWLKVSARCGRESIRARAGWESWRDETDSVVAPSAGIYRFAAIAPVRSSRQRIYIDHIGIFIPYFALDLPAGRHDIELNVGVYSQSGELLVSVAIEETIRLAALEAPGVVLAPQALGLWDFEPVNGSRITLTGSVVRLEGDPGWEEPILEVGADITLVDMAGDRLEGEVRLRRADGTVVASLVGEGGGSFEPALGRLALLPQQPVSELNGVRAVLPLRYLDLAPGHQHLFVELAVCAGDGRVVCGAFAPVDFEIPAGGSKGRGVSPELHVAADSDIDVLGVDIAPCELNGEPALGVGITVSVRDWESSRYRIVVALEGRDGSPICNIAAEDRPVLRSFCFGGERGRLAGETRTVRAVFDAREFGRFLKTRPAAERDIVARVSIASESGRVLFESTRAISGNFIGDVKAALPPSRPTSPAQVVAVEFDEGIGDS